MERIQCRNLPGLATDDNCMDMICDPCFWMAQTALQSPPRSTCPAWKEDTECHRAHAASLEGQQESHTQCPAPKNELRFITESTLLFQKQISHGDCASVYQIGLWQALSHLLCVENSGLIASFSKTKGLPASLPSPVTAAWCWEPCQFLPALEMSLMTGLSNPSFCRVLLFNPT